MSPSAVALTRAERAATLAIDCPPLNILDLSTLDELSRHLNQLAEDESLQLLVLRGAGGRAFSAGVAIEDHTRDRIAASLAHFHRVLRKIASLPALSIAAVDGHCLGGGMELAAACDFVLATPEATFGQPEIELGCFPPAAAAVYPARLGHSKTLELLATGARLDARAAHSAGFVTWIADGPLDDALAERSAPILDKSAAVTRALKRTLHAGRKDLFEGELERAERAYLTELLETADLDEGLAAFFEKRAPVWRHR